MAKNRQGARQATRPAQKGPAKKRSPYRRLIRQTKQFEAASEGGKYRTPPLFSFNPAIEAERRAAIRGVRDVAEDARIGANRLRQDTRLERRNLRMTRRRGKTDLRRTRQRGLQDIGFQRADIQRQLDRGLQDIGLERADIQLQRERGEADIRRAHQQAVEDIGLQLEELTRRYQQLAGRQTQQANAQGVLGSAVLAASREARSRNLAFERQPLDIARARVEEDLIRGLGRLDEDTRLALERLGLAEARLRGDTTTALERLGIEQSRLLQDVRTGRRRLNQDFRHDTRLIKQDYRRSIRDLLERFSRAAREQRIGDVDLILEEIFEARNRRPGVFTKYGTKRKTGRD